MIDFAGTSRRPPCGACEGTGYDIDAHRTEGILRACIACNGTKVAPLDPFVAAVRRDQRQQGMSRNAFRAMHRRNQRQQR
jgi:hypothetical protein